MPTLADRLRSAAGRAGRALLSFSSVAPPAPGFEPRTPDRPDRDSKTVAALRREEALYGRVTYRAGPQQTRYSTNPATGLEPQQIWSIQLRRNQGYPHTWTELCEQVLERDGHLGGVYDTRRQSVADKPFRIHPARRNDPLAEALAKLAERAVDRIDAFDQTVEDLLSAPAYGYAICEIVWTRAKLRFPTPSGETVTAELRLPKQLDWVHWKHVRFDQETDEPYLWLDQDVTIPPHKFVFHASAGTGLIERRGFMGSCIWLSAAKRWSERDWLVYAKLFGIPQILGKYQGGLEEYQRHRDQYQQILKDFGEGIPALVPDELVVEISRDAGGRSGDIHGAIIGWANAEMSKRILGSTLTVEMGGQGSWAAADTHRDAPYMRSRADARKLAATLRRDLLTSIVEVNAPALAAAYGVPPEDLLDAIPRWSWRIDREMTPTDRLEVYKGARDYGYRVSKQQFADEFGLDEAMTEDDLLPGKNEIVSKGGMAVPSAEIAEADDPVMPPPDEPADPSASGAPRRPDRRTASDAVRMAGWNESDHPREKGKFAPKGGGSSGSGRKTRPFRLKSPRVPRPRQPPDPNAPAKPPREYHRDHLGRFATKPRPNAAQLTLPTKLPTKKKAGKVKPDPSKVPGAPGRTTQQWRVRVTNDPENGYKGRSYALASLDDGVKEFMAAPATPLGTDWDTGGKRGRGWTNADIFEAVIGKGDERLWDDLNQFFDLKGSKRIKDQYDAIRACLRPTPGVRGKRDWRDFDIEALREAHPAFKALQAPEWLHDAKSHQETAEYYRQQAEQFSERTDVNGPDADIDDASLPDYGGYEEYQAYDHHGNASGVPF